MSCPYHWELEPHKAVIPASAGIHLLSVPLGSGHRTQVTNLRYQEGVAWETVPVIPAKACPALDTGWESIFSVSPLGSSQRTQVSNLRYQEGVVWETVPVIPAKTCPVLDTGWESIFSVSP